MANTRLLPSCELRDGSAAGSASDREPAASPVRPRRRKLKVVLGLLLPATAGSLFYVHGRPAGYRASSRFQFNPGAVQIESLKATVASQGAEVPRPLMSRLQVPTSRPVLEAAVARLSSAMSGKVAALVADPVAAFQSSLGATAARETDTVAVSATGADLELLTTLVNTIIGIYTDRLEAAYRETPDEFLERLNEELAPIQTQVSQTRRVVEEFRQKCNVISLQRYKNQLLSRARGQAASLNVANQKLALPEGRLCSLKEATTQWRSVVRSRDDLTIANMGQRALRLREDLRKPEQSYAPDYLARDNKAASQRRRLAELEPQIDVERKAVRTSALGEATEEGTSRRTSSVLLTMPTLFVPANSRQMLFAAPASRSSCGGACALVTSLASSAGCHRIAPPLTGNSIHRASAFESKRCSGSCQASAKHHPRPRSDGQETRSGSTGRGPGTGANRDAPLGRIRAIHSP